MVDRRPQKHPPKSLLTQSCFASNLTSGTMLRPSTIGNVNELFAPPDHQWQQVSTRLRTVRRLFIVAACVLVTALAVAVILIFTDLWAVAALVAVLQLAAAVWGWVWADRNQRAWGYAENTDDLVVTSGVMFKRLVAVPYGRMQFVDVSAGPIHRAFGIASVTLHTASTETAATIPGLTAQRATALRNRLTELGEAHGAGI